MAMAGTVEQILSRPLTQKEQAYQRKQEELNSAASAVTESTEAPEFKPMQFYDEFINSQAGYTPETPEQRMKREKQERTNKIIAGVGDMISALANMYYTTKGAPNSYDPREGMTPKMQARYDQLQKEREARDKDYLSGLQRARQLDQQYNLSWQQLKEQREHRRVEDERLKQQAAERKAEKEADLAEKVRHNKVIEAIQQQNANKPKGGSGRGSSTASKGVKVEEQLDNKGKLKGTKKTYYEDKGAAQQKAAKGKWAAFRK